MLRPYLDELQRESLALLDDFGRRAVSWRDDNPAMYPPGVAARSLQWMEETTATSTELLRYSIELVEASVRQSAHAQPVLPVAPDFLLQAQQVMTIVDDRILQRLRGAGTEDTETVVSDIIDAFMECSAMLGAVAAGIAIFYS